MAVYDFVMADMLSSSKYYAGATVIRRFSTETPIRDSVNVITTIVDYINEASKSDSFNFNDAVKSSIEILNVIRNVVTTTGGTTKDLIQFRELLEVLSFNGFEVYLIERFDIIDGATPISDEIKAYLLSMSDQNVVGIPRFVSGWGSTYPTRESASMGRIVSDYLTDTIKFDDEVEDLIKLKSYIDDFNTLASAGAESEFDVVPLLKFIEGNQYKILVSLS